MKEYSRGLKLELLDNMDGYTVSGIGTCRDAFVVIPSVYEGRSAALMVISF